MATISDVARLAGVSLSTVSYALSGKRPIREETRKRIFEVIDALNFAPNALARGLAGQRSSLIALLCPSGERALGSSEMELVSGAFERVHQDGFQLLMWMTEAADLDELNRLLRLGLVDGVLVMEVHMRDERIKLLQETGFPFVMLGRTEEPAGLDYSDTDFEQTVRIALDHLAGLGHQDIVFLNQPEKLLADGYAPVIRIEQAVREIAASAGLSLLVQRVGLTREEGRNAYATCRRELPNASAVVSLNEPGTIAFMAAAIADGRKIPVDLSVVSLIASGSVAEMSIPALTTSGPGLANVGWSGADALIRRLQGYDGGPIHKLASSELIIRESTGQRKG